MVSLIISNVCGLRYLWIAALDVASCWVRGRAQLLKLGARPLQNSLVFAILIGDPFVLQSDPIAQTLRWKGRMFSRASSATTSLRPSKTGFSNKLALAPTSSIFVLYRSTSGGLAVDRFNLLGL
jgi:hypothetical protein